MAIFSSKKAKTKFKPTTLDLPLGALVFETDSTTQERTATPNPDLPQILGRFAYYLDKGVGSGTLYPRVFKNWLLDYLVKDDVDPSRAKTITIGGKPTYQLLPDRQTTSDLFAKIRASILSSPATECYVYVGLYLLVAWFYLIDSADTGLLGSRIKRFVATQCLDWKYKEPFGGTVTLKRDFVVDVSNAYTPTFLRQFTTTGFSVQDMRRPINLGNAANFLTDASDGKIAPGRVFNFIQFFRGLFTEILKQEYISLLRQAGLDTAKTLADFGLYAVGDGSTTMGIFGITGLGIPFFDYEGTAAAAPKFFEPKTARDVVIPSTTGHAAPSIFIAQWGANSTAGAGIEIQVKPGGTAKPPAIKLSSITDSFFPDITNPGQFAYSNATGLLTFAAGAAIPIMLGFDTHADETVFFTLSFHSSIPVQLSSPDPRLRIDHLFLDNEFVISQPVLTAFWSSPAQQTVLDALILKMRDSSNFVIVSSILGLGIGVRIDMNGPDEFAPDLVPAQDQTDNQIPNTVAFENVGLRYAYGETIWTSGSGGQPDVLNLCAEGFVSPLRCTWSSWPPFQLNTQQPPFNRKADELQTDIGQYLRDSLGLGPSYNTALSAFRAFGMLEAMVRKLQLRADDLDPAQLSDQQRDAIIVKLETFLNTQAKCVLLQAGLKEDVGVTIDYGMFRKYGY